MALIAKSHVFSPATLISSSQMNTNFDALYNTLAGSNTTTQVKVASSDGNTPVVLDQQTSGNTQEWQDTGVTRLKVLKSGALESVIPTGTAPLVVASQTVVTNLNVGLLEGRSSSEFVQLTAGVATISHTEPVLRLVDTTAGQTDYDIRLTTVGSVSALVITEQDTSVDVMSINPSGRMIVEDQVRVNSAAPTNDADLTRKDYVDTRTVPWSVTAFFPGAASTGQPIHAHIIPDGAVGVVATKMVATYHGGSNSGTTTMLWHHNGVFKHGISMTTSLFGVVVTNNITDTPLAAGDVLKFDMSAAGSHADVSLQLIGTQQVMA